MQKLKVSFIGDSGVGKSNIMTRFVENRYDSKTDSTVGVDYKSKVFSVNHVPITFEIWETAGQERFRGITGAYCRGAQAIAIVYDVTNWSSFQNCGMWWDFATKWDKDHTAFVLVANKMDMQDQCVSQEKGQALARKWGIPFCEVSAKSGLNVNQLFVTFAQEYSHKLQKHPLVQINSLHISSETVAPVRACHC